MVAYIRPIHDQGIQHLNMEGESIITPSPSKTEEILVADSYSRRESRFSPRVLCDKLTMVQRIVLYPCVYGQH